MYVERMLPTPETSFMVSRLLYQAHIYSAVDDSMHDVWGVHNFLSEIESGQRIVFGVFDEKNNIFLGCMHCTLHGDYCVAHTMFKRKVDAVKAALMAEDELKKYCKKNKILLNAIVGYPPEHLRAAVIMNKKFGCKDMGQAENVFFKVNGKNMPCRYMRKEL
jgi:hypothetical protein